MRGAQPRPQLSSSRSIPFHGPTGRENLTVPWVRIWDTKARRGNLDGKKTSSLWVSHQAELPELVTRAGAEAAGRGGPQAKIIREKP